MRTQSTHRLAKLFCAVFCTLFIAASSWGADRLGFESAAPPKRAGRFQQPDLHDLGIFHHRVRLRQ